jgi:Zn-dependent M28 family amino/carboxypeptidase
MIQRLRFSIVAILGVLSILCSLAGAQVIANVRDVIASIAKGSDSAERRRAITAQLDAAGIEYRLEDFEDARMRKGVNVVAAVSQGQPKTILIGAHYDRVAVGEGALDNAASCAALLDLLSRFKAKPLANYRLTAVFFDLEEGGLGGSQAYFASGPDKQSPTYAINLDIFGYGDSIWAAVSKPEGNLSSALQQASTRTNFPVRTSPPAEYPASDHRNMIGAGIETLGVALIDGSEIDGVLNLLARRTTQVPPILTIIHTPKDTVEATRPGDIEKGIAFLERLIRLTDEKF